MMNRASELDRLLTIMDELREKCPWDRKQTLESLRPLTIEELYELVDAIADKDWQHIKEELGDVLLHLVFYAKIASEQEQFDMYDVIQGICDKLIARHPHVYGDLKLADEKAVKQNWEKLKIQEGKTSVLAGVPQSLPAVIKALRIQDKAKQVGFEWKEVADVIQKLDEEVAELEEARKAGSEEAMEEEFGDVLFSLINYSRFLGVDPEVALERTNRKFIKRFMFMEETVAGQGKSLSDLNLDQMEELWQQAKIQTIQQ